MAKIRIKSNPYTREIEYSSYKEQSGQWEDIKNGNNNSKLREDESGRNFLPFKIKEIIDIIVAEYYVDGEPLKNFDPTVTGYTSRLSYAATLPTVTASSLTCTKIEVTNAEDFGKDYVIKVYADGNDDLYRVYRVSFTKLPTLEAIDGMTRYSVKAVTACCIQEEALGNIPENVIDNDFTTSRWTAESVALGESHEITLELDDVSKVNKIGFAFYNGHKRYTIFAVHVSTDGNAWTEVFNGNSSGTTAALEYFYESDAGIDAKYVRFTGYGNSKNGWNNITEFVVLGGN